MISVLDFDKFMRAMREPLTPEARETIAGIPVVANDRLPEGVVMLMPDPLPYRDGRIDLSKIVILKIEDMK